MRLTLDHLRYWQAKKAQPGWAKEVAGLKGKPLSLSSPIHTLINEHAGLKDRGGHHAGNLIAILKLIRKREPSLLPDLQRIAACPGTVINPQRRAGYAKKWAQRIQSTKEPA